jgi:hypothetical protein
MVPGQSSTGVCILFEGSKGNSLPGLIAEGPLAEPQLWDFFEQVMGTPYSRLC